MGTWGTGSFENDAAADLLLQFQDERDPTLLLRVLEFAAEPSYWPLGLLEAPEAQEAVASAEIVAACLGKPGDAFLLEWNGLLDGLTGLFEPAIIPVARQALYHVLNGSELMQLWKDSDDDGQAAQAIIQEVLRRL